MLCILNIGSSIHHSTATFHPSAAAYTLVSFRALSFLRFAARALPARPFLKSESVAINRHVHFAIVIAPKHTALAGFRPYCHARLKVAFHHSPVSGSTASAKASQRCWAVASTALAWPPHTT